MGNVNLPTPVALSAGALCVLGGYLLGVVVGTDTAARTTATVRSYDADASRLCLEGDGVEAQEGMVVDGVLCGTWRRTQGSRTVPAEGDEFRFVAVSPEAVDRPEGQARTTVIYGDVVQ